MEWREAEILSLDVALEGHGFELEQEGRVHGLLSAEGSGLGALISHRQDLGSGRYRLNFEITDDQLPPGATIGEIDYGYGARLSLVVRYVESDHELGESTFEVESVPIDVTLFRKVILDHLREVWRKR